MIRKWNPINPKRNKYELLLTIIKNGKPTYRTRTQLNTDLKC